MSGFVALIICHVGIFIFVRWYMDSDLIKRGGDHSLTSLFVLWMIVIPLFMTSTGLGAGVWDAFGDPAGSLAILGTSVVLALSWALPLMVMTSETLSRSTVDKMMGLTREVLDESNLKLAHDLLRKGEREEAFVELMRQRDNYPEAPSPRFMLAALAQDENEYEKAAEYYREILQKCGHYEWAWINAAQSLAELLRNELNDAAGADYLEAEIRRKNPDGKYKMSKTADKKKAKQKYKKKRKGPSRPKKESRRAPEQMVDINQARRLVQRGDIPEAMGLFRRYIEAHPGEVKVHFELISLYERHDRADDAVARLQKLIHDYGKDDDVWGNAMLRLASIRETHEGDHEAARLLLKSVADRLKHAKHGVDARQRLKDLYHREQAES